MFSYSGEKPPKDFKRVRVWDVASGHEIISFRENIVSKPAFLPDGQRIILKPKDGKLEIREVRTGKVLARFEDSSPDADLLGLTPGGTLALTGSWRGEEGIRLVDVQTRKLVRVLDKRRSGPPAIFTPDGKTVYVQVGAKGKDDFAFGVWQLPGGQLVRYSRQSDYEFYPLAFSPDGKLALSDTPENRPVPAMRRLVLWDAASGAEVRWLRRAAPGVPPATPFTYDAVSCAGFSADGKRVMAVLFDRTLRSWDVATGAELWSTRVEGWSAAISADGRQVVTASGSISFDIDLSALPVRLWDATDGHFVKALSGPATLPENLGPGK
jgi:WD40 repeat protein